MKRHGWMILGLAAAIGGCVNPPSGPRAAAPLPTTLPATRPSDPKVVMSLDEIQPRPVLGRAKPTTRPAPLDALTLYARARDELAGNRRYTAINLLDQALRLDPDSFELNYALGRAYSSAGGMNERAITALEKAAEIDPDDLEIQFELSRAYLTRNNIEKTVERLRLAQQTTEYKEGDALAVAVDYRLGSLLKQQGYVKAALQCFTSLQARLEHPNGGSRTVPEVVYLMSRPELVFEDIGRMHEELGELSEAMKAYQRVAAATPEDFDAQARVIRMLVRLGRGPEASAAAAELVRVSRATPESIALLRDIHEKTGARGDFVEELRRLNRERPNDRSLIFALANTLAGSGQIDQAADLLNRQIEANKGDTELVQRLYQIYADRDQVGDAARVIFRAMVAQPQATSELLPLLEDLTRYSRKNALRLATLTKLQVPPASEPAKQYFIARVASKDRPTVSRQALAQAANATPVFDPACQLIMADYLTRPDMDDAARKVAAEALIQSVRTRGRGDLAERLAGQMAMAARQVDQAVMHLEQAVLQAPAGGPSPDLLIEYALALREQGNVPRFEQMLWKLVSDRPRTTDAYLVLLDHYESRNADSQAWNVRNSWLAADPTNVAARLKLVRGLLDLRRGDEALTQMRRLFDDNPDDDSVVRSLTALFMSADMRPQLIELLEAERLRHPNNRIAIEALVSTYAESKRPADATRVIEAARAAVAKDPDLLYYVANLYHSVDQPQMTEQILQDVLRLDPNHPQAANDLGYTWADAGKNLEQAESLIRTAVTAERDNPSYLDSLGWVLYKRSKFDESMKLLREAAEPAQSADPIVLDHLGDALYRLGQWGDAQATWQAALVRSAAELALRPGRNDLQQLQVTLQTKLQQASSGQPVSVAPVVEVPPNSQTSSTGQQNGRP